MKRRDFLTTTVGATGYSMFISVDSLAADPQEQAKRSADEIRKELERIAPTGNRTAAPAERNMTMVDLDCDVLVAGGGLAGVLAAVSAARHGAKVRTIRDDSFHA